MKQETNGILHWINTCEKLSERYFVSCGKSSVKDITSYLIAKASKGIFKQSVPQFIPMLSSILEPSLFYKELLILSSA